MKLLPKVEEETFEVWARKKYGEVEKRLNPCNPDGTLDPVRLNEVLISFSGHFAWCIMIQEVESNKLQIMQHEFDSWYKAQYNLAYRTIQVETGGGRPPGQVTIDARIVDMSGEELERRRRELENQRSRVDLLKGLVKVLDRQASILQTVSSNMRSELFFAGGVGVIGGMKDNERNNAAKTVLRQALRSQGVDS